MKAIYLYNESTKKAFRTDAKMQRNIDIKSRVSDVSYLKRITLKEIKTLKIELL